VAPDSARPLFFERITQRKTHEYVAEQIRRQITLRLLPPGRAIPPERQLARMFGVGRATVQQAIDLLEADRIVERRRGRSGGTLKSCGATSTPCARRSTGGWRLSR
jgi:DNA-binding FadR family transcriptional regulator